MATSTPKSFNVALTTSDASLFPGGLPVPAGKVRHMLLLELVSTDAVNSAKGTLTWVDADNSNRVGTLLHQAPVPVSDKVPVNVGSFALNAGDDLRGLASANGDLEVNMTYYDEDVV